MSGALLRTSSLCGLLALLILIYSANLKSAPKSQELRSEAVAPSVEINPNGLRRLLTDLLNSKKAGDAQAFKALTDGLVVPNHNQWFSETFGALRGAAMDSVYEKQLGGSKEGLASQFDQMRAAESVDFIIRLAPDQPDSNDPVAVGLHKFLKTSQVFYIADWTKAGDTKEFHIGYFIFVENSFRFLQQDLLAGLAAPVRVRDDVFMKDKITNKVMPIYPRMALEHRLSGTVLVRIIVGTDGRVRQVQVISGHPLLAAAVPGAVRQWHYKPTSVMGEPVEVETSLRVVFSFDQDLSFGTIPKVSFYP
jgi:TonB family protein